MDNTATQKTQPVCVNGMEDSHQILKKKAGGGLYPLSKWPSHQNNDSFTPEDDAAANIFK